MKVLRGLLVLIAVVAAGAIAAAPAGATFAAPFNVSAGLAPGFDPSVAMNDAGEAIFVWSEQDAGGIVRVKERTRDASGVLGRVRTLSPSGHDALGPRVAIDDDGDAAFTWQRKDTTFQIEGRTQSAAGTLGPVVPLSDAAASAAEQQVAITDAGDAIFAWTRPDGTNTRIESRALSAAGVPDSVRKLSAAGQDASAPRVAVDGAGRAIFVWTRSDGTNLRVQDVVRTASGAFGPRQTLSTAGHPALSPELAVDNSGAAAFTWTFYDGAEFRVQTRALAVGGNLSGVQNLSPAGTDAGSQQVGINEAGDAVFVWSQSNGSNNQVAERGRRASGVLDHVHTLSSLGEDAETPDVAVAPTGDAVFTWQQFDPPNLNVVQARERDPSGQLFALQIVSESENGEEGTTPVVGIDGDGDALLAWQQQAAHVQIQAAVGP